MGDTDLAPTLEAHADGASPLRGLPGTALARRALAGRALPVLLIVGALATFYALRHGHVVTGMDTVAYADATHHRVAPVAPGRIDRVTVAVGQAVRKGDVVVEMDAAARRLELEKSRLELARREADLRAAAQTQDSEVTRSELWVLKAKADERGDRAELAELRSRVVRLDQLVADKLVGSSEAERAKERLRALSARVETYDQATQLGRGGLAASTGPRSQHQTDVEARLEPLRQAIQVQRAAIALLELEVAELTVKAPCDGVVSVLVRQPGEVVEAGAEIVTLVTARPKTVVAMLSEQAVEGVRPGAVVDVKRNQFTSASYPGRVVSVAPELEELPLRARPSPQTPLWGRRVLIELTIDGELVPGEAFRVSLR
ncbi:MAG: HlyD family efflux transporter periplasmic adaptor subunit [Polyangiaceae bacterium]|nr:HlyD family efflux transporter periplasmic adaptor subunit [Polyangiaceae bacterium]